MRTVSNHALVHSGLVHLRSDGPDRAGLQSLRARRRIELDALALGELSVAIAFDRREVDEHVRAAVFGGDEAEALGPVEPLHCAGAHCCTYRSHHARRTMREPEWWPAHDVVHVLNQRTHQYS